MKKDIQVSVTKPNGNNEFKSNIFKNITNIIEKYAYGTVIDAIQSRPL